MQGIDWDDLRHFLAVVQAGSVSRAAVVIGVNQTTVSRRVAALEQRLGKQLFERVGNAWHITPVGERLIATVEQMADQAHTIERQVLADSRELSGQLRVTAGDVCTQALMMPAVAAFARRYPEVDIEVIATREVLDLAAREADVALRATSDPPPNLVGKRIGELAYRIYGTAEMLERVEANLDGPSGQGVPCITWLGDPRSRPPWVERSFPATPRLYRTSELGVMRQMASEGIAIAQLPCALAEPDPLLQRIPAAYVEPGWELWVLSHVDLRTTARVRLFRDLLVAELERQLPLIEGHRLDESGAAPVDARTGQPSSEV